MMIRVDIANTTGHGKGKAPELTWKRRQSDDCGGVQFKGGAIRASRFLADEVFDVNKRKCGAHNRAEGGRVEHQVRR